jgi:hypothetical protein
MRCSVVMSEQKATYYLEYSASSEAACSKPSAFVYCTSSGNRKFFVLRFARSLGNTMRCLTEASFLGNCVELSRWIFCTVTGI